MKNFGLEELVLVRPCVIGEEATKRAMHGIDVLKGARTVFTDDEALTGADFVAATSGVDTTNDKHFNRISMTPREFAEKVKGLEGTIALVFGREDFGLDKELLRRCDFLITIPANPEYSILNLSHAASIVFYEMFAIRRREVEAEEGLGDRDGEAERVLREAPGSHRLPGAQEGEDEGHVQAHDREVRAVDLGVPHAHGDIRRGDRQGDGEGHARQETRAKKRPVPISETDD